MSGDDLFSEQEAEEILRLASQQVGDGISRERLIHMADELGISSEAVTTAAKTVQAQRTEKAERKEFEVFQRRSFFNHLASYVIVNLGLIGFNLAQSHRITWAIWPIIGWGIGVASQASHTFFRGSESYEEEFQKWRVARAGGQTSDAHKPKIVIGAHIATGIPAPIPPQILPIVENIALRDNLGRLEAIRVLREETGLGLKEAKDAIDEFERQNPGIFTRW